MKITKQELRQIIKEELEAVMKGAEEFFKIYKLSPKNGKVYLPYDKDEFNEIMYQLEGEPIDYEETDDGSGVVITYDTSQVTEADENEEDIAGTLADTGVADS